jgi:hypothetical protein
MAQFRFSGLVSKFVKRTKIDSRRADQPSFNRIMLVETEPESECRCAAVRVPTQSCERVVDRGFELLPLLVGDSGTQVLDFHRALAHEDELRDIVDPSYPRIAN